MITAPLQCPPDLARRIASHVLAGFLDDIMKYINNLNKEQMMVVSQFLGILCSKVAIVSHECKSSSFHPLDAIL